MHSKDLSKELLYQSVKTLVEAETPHLHLPQQKLFTLYSIAFQYFLYCATKCPGAYIIRIEDSLLADKLMKKSKDSSTRRFLETLMVPRKLKFQASTFYLDFFHLGTWSLTNEIPKEKIKGALIIKNSTCRPMQEVDEEQDPVLAALPPNYYYTSLQEFVPKTVLIAYGEAFPNTKVIEFPFIEKERERLAHGVTISKDIDLGNLD